MIKLVLLREGQSIWDVENKFTGWTDTDLTKEGMRQVRDAGKMLREDGFEFDIIYTSRLKRAIRTTEIIIQEMGLHDVKIENEWRLNDRHYGALEGLNKEETAKKFGEDQVLKWRRTYDVQPPALDKADARWPGNNPAYKDLDPKFLPFTESLKDTIDRAVPYWNEIIAKALKNSKKILIVASGNALRGLVMHIDKLSNEDIMKFTIPQAVPLVYEMDGHLKVTKQYFLGDKKEVKKAIKEVEEAGKDK